MRIPDFLLPPWAALAFLTRLVPPPPPDERTLAAAVAWYPLAGLAIGLLACLPFLAACAAAYPFIQGWLYVLISLWGTRGLHWDGLADVADAWGSNRHGADFHAVLKDSRIGAFGVIALIMGLGGQWMLAGTLYARGEWLPLVLAPVAGRAGAVALAALVPPHPDSRLGRLAAAGASRRLAAGMLAGVGIAACPILGGAQAVAALAGLGAILGSLARLAGKEGGLNGDFCGCTIILTECLALGAALV
jgi:adenosylcobinamide-GDP ribazoletransferase